MKPQLPRKKAKVPAKRAAPDIPSHVQHASVTADILQVDVLPWQARLVKASKRSRGGVWLAFKASDLALVRSKIVRHSQMQDR